MYEHHTHRILTVRQFARRVFGHFVVASFFIAVALGIGVVGYHELAGLRWVDALLNAAMILGGMGPVDSLQNKGDAAKVFAAMYALFSGLVFIGILGVLLAPFAHRLLHRLHVDDAA